ncbi:unnamed protein product [Hermetia illucens]|uniref:Uncharacterized protein n=1 Tax=Hermetia illucens TaxID=343691 RepID=A0A7R8UPX8_HERIL|nr:unnamed protein product [Hermetia illucens]
MQVVRSNHLCTNCLKSNHYSNNSGGRVHAENVYVSTALCCIMIRKLRRSKSTSDRSQKEISLAHPDFNIRQNVDVLIDTMTCGYYKILYSVAAHCSMLNMDEFLNQTFQQFWQAEEMD